MSTATSPSCLEAFLAQFEIPNARMERIRAGRNSRVWRVDTPTDAYIVKEYFRHPGDHRDRLTTEYGFLDFLQSQGITTIPQPLARDLEGRFALYSYLPGHPVATIHPHHIRQASDFIDQINRCRTTDAASQLPGASEACFSLSEHLNRVKIRLQSLQAALAEAAEPIQVKAWQFLCEYLWPTYAQLEQRLQAIILSGYELATTLKPEQRILSPSDFGFHNTLEANGQLYFLDFEYAGWDDPAKLLCDFACQPQRPVSQEQAQRFWGYLSHLAVLDRVTLLLPLYRLKWCCILLNEFRAQDRQRRAHAGDNQGNRLEQQLHKAQTYFHQHLRDY
jgi:hypothetical protein